MGGVEAVGGGGAPGGRGGGGAGKFAIELHMGGEKREHLTKHTHSHTLTHTRGHEILMFNFHKKLHINIERINFIIICSFINRIEFGAINLGGGGRRQQRNKWLLRGKLIVLSQ